MPKKRKEPPITQGPEPTTKVAFSLALTVLMNGACVGYIRPQDKVWVLEFRAQAGLQPKSAEFDTIEAAKEAATEAWSD